MVGKGTDVYSIDGYKLGQIDEIAFDEHGKISGFSFEKGHIFSKKEFNVSVDDVDGITSDYVRLKVTRDALAAR